MLHPIFWCEYWMRSPPERAQHVGNKNRQRKLKATPCFSWYLTAVLCSMGTICVFVNANLFVYWDADKAFFLTVQLCCPYALMGAAAWAVRSNPIGSAIVLVVAVVEVEVSIGSWWQNWWDLVPTEEIYGFHEANVESLSFRVCWGLQMVLATPAFVLAWFSWFLRITGKPDKRVPPLNSAIEPNS
jgi:hypothetical protein